jgi:hypothetical protein
VRGDAVAEGARGSENGVHVAAPRFAEGRCYAAITPQSLKIAYSPCRGSRMRSRVWFVLLGFLSLAIISPTAQAFGGGFLPAGTLVSVQTTQPLDANFAEPGMSVSAIVDDPVVDGRGAIVIPRGTAAAVPPQRADEDLTTDVVVLTCAPAGAAVLLRRTRRTISLLSG